MANDFQGFVDKFDAPACILSVERNETNHRRTIRIVTGNRPYIDTIEKPVPKLNEHPKTFLPNLKQLSGCES